MDLYKNAQILEPTHQAPLPLSLERKERPLDPGPRPPAPSEPGGPRKPDTGSPDKDNLLKRMRKVDPKQAERYRQRTGE